MSAPGAGARWIRLAEGYDGPRVRALAVAPTGAHPPLPVLALIDTGATGTLIDRRRVAHPLGLRAVDRQVVRTAGREPATMDVHELGLRFPDFPVPGRVLRVGAVDLPQPFAVLVGMDLLEGTRLALEWRAGERWLRWEPIPG